MLMLCANIFPSIDPGDVFRVTFQAAALVWEAKQVALFFGKPDLFNLVFGTFFDSSFLL